MRKTLPYLFVLALTGFLVWFFYFQKTYRNPFAEVEAIEAIPQSTAIILEFDDYFMLRHAIAKMPYMEEMSGAFFVKKMSEDFKYLRQMFSKDKNHRQLLLNNSITTSLHVSGQKNVDFLYVIKDDEKVFDLEKLLSDFSHQKSQSQRNSVYQLSLGNNEKYTIAYRSGLILISRYAYLVEDGLQQLNDLTHNLKQSQQLVFQKDINKSENQINVYVLFENLKSLANPFIQKNKPDYFTQLAKYVKVGKWVLDFQEEGVKINGVLKSNGNKWLDNVFYNNKHTVSKNQEILPENIAYFFKQTLKGVEGNYKLDENEKGIFETYFLPWLGEEWLVGRTEVFTRKMKAEKFVAFQFKDLKMTQYHLEKLSDSVGLVKSWSHQTYPIRQLNIKALPIPFNKVEKIFLQKPCYTFIDDYVIFAGAGYILENWIDQYLTGQTLASHVPFLKMKSRAGESGVGELFWNGKTANQFLKNTFKSKIAEEKKQLELWGNFPAVGLNFNWEEEEIQSSGFLFFQKEKTQKAQVKWRTNLQAMAQTPPYPIFNKEKNAYEILIQDEQNRLYMLNSEGEEIWNRTLESPLKSRVWVADFEEDEPPLILFNTANKIHLINFAGEPQNEFPLKLASLATNGILLADFGEEDYGMFIACENGLLYGFDKNGIPLSGWNSLEGVGEVLQPMQHFQTTAEDYIIIQNTSGDVFSYNKNGFPETEVFNVTNHFDAPLCFQFQEKKMVVADQSGTPQIFSLKGGKQIASQKGISQQSNYKFAATDLAGDSQKDFAVLENKKLEIFYHHKNEFKQYGTHQFSNQPEKIFGVQSTQMGKGMIGALCERQGQIYLLDKKGKLHSDFPLAGTTQFELVNLFKSDENVVVVADGKQVVVYEVGN